jgi:hypothetical protein
LDQIRQIVSLRFAVGFLGEAGQAGWWRSGFLGPNARPFLSPVFETSLVMAQYSGVTEAACRVHDEHIGVGQRTFHLFRLPEAVEQRLFDLLQRGGDAVPRVDSPESAEDVLNQMATGLMEVKPGPIRIGFVDMVESPIGPATLASYYRAAFKSGVKCFPYLNSPA